MRSFLVILSFFFLNTRAQVVDSLFNLNNHLVLFIHWDQDIRIVYTYDTSTVWYKNLGFNPDSLYQAPPDTMNVIIGGGKDSPSICFLSVYQPGIEYVYLDAVQESPWLGSPVVIDLLRENPQVKGWILLRKDPLTYVTLDLTRKILKMYKLI